MRPATTARSTLGTRTGDEPGSDSYFLNRVGSAAPPPRPPGILADLDLADEVFIKYAVVDDADEARKVYWLRWRRCRVRDGSVVGPVDHHDRLAISGPLSTAKAGHVRCLPDSLRSLQALLDAPWSRPSKLVMRVRFSPPAPHC
jgi:hypothetical protein